MNRFTKQNLTTRIFQSINYSLILFVAIITTFILAIASISAKTESNEKQLLNDALSRDIVHCYSVEGAYPPSLDYIENNYGLTYDHDKFIVHYESIGNNLMPNFSIIER